MLYVPLPVASTGESWSSSFSSSNGDAWNKRGMESMCRPCGKGVAGYGVNIAAPTSSAGAGVETSALSSNKDGEGTYA